MFWSEKITEAVIDFLQDESNRSVLGGLKIAFQKGLTLDRSLYMRGIVLGQLGNIPLESGAKMGLMVRFIEIGISMVDWNMVIRELELDQKLSGRKTKMGRISIDEVANAANLGLDAFVEAGGAYSGDNTDEKIVDFISALRHLSDRYGFSWNHVVSRADKLYHSDKQES